MRRGSASKRRRDSAVCSVPIHRGQIAAHHPKNNAGSMAILYLDFLSFVAPNALSRP
ncbi:hypothetical protein PUN4_1040037 [Paraburkholderia unamae]|nr:hypothetical protein PUN4_1040037 [Paraburkholderia unamae]